MRRGRQVRQESNYAGEQAWKSHHHGLARAYDLAQRAHFLGAHAAERAREKRQHDVRRADLIGQPHRFSILIHEREIRRLASYCR